jgi:hypothetical protein
MVNIVLIIVAVVFIVLLFIANVFLLVHFQAAEDRLTAWFPKIVVVRRRLFDVECVVLTDRKKA